MNYESAEYFMGLKMFYVSIVYANFIKKTYIQNSDIMLPSGINGVDQTASL